MPPMAQPILMPRSSMYFSRKRFAARLGPPTPVWKENPSLKYGVEAMTFATFSAIIKSRGFWLMRAAAEAIFFGLPMESTTTTASTSIASTEAGMFGKSTRQSVTTTT